MLPFTYDATVPQHIQFVVVEVVHQYAYLLFSLSKTIAWNNQHFIRVSYQGYNDERDMEKLIEAMKKILT